MALGILEISGHLTLNERGLSDSRADMSDEQLGPAVAMAHLAVQHFEYCEAQRVVDAKEPQ